MPLLDHFNLPLRERRRWQGLFSAWASSIAALLNEQLPPRYFAEPTVGYGGRIEVDIAAFDEEPLSARAGVGVTTAVWAPSHPTTVLSVAPPPRELFEVRIFNDEEGPRLVAAIELVSPANKDRPASRRAFGIKCAALLHQRVSVAMVDVVTSRRESWYPELAAALGISYAGGAPALQACSFRMAGEDPAAELQCWLETPRVGSPLPTLPLWISPTLPLPLELERSYLTACRSLRITM